MWNLSNFHSKLRLDRSTRLGSISIGIAAWNAGVLTALNETAKPLTPACRFAPVLECGLASDRTGACTPLRYTARRVFLDTISTIIRKSC